MFIHVDPNSRLAKVILVAGIPLFAVLLWLQMDEFELAYRSTNWPVARGTILKSKVETHTDMHGIPHSTAKIDYDYRVNGRQFLNSRIAFGLCRGKMTWGYADRKVDDWPKGKIATVHYNPLEPKVSCLEPGSIGWEDCFFLLIAATGIAFGSKTAFSAVRSVAERWRSPALEKFETGDLSRR